MLMKLFGVLLLTTLVASNIDDTPFKYLWNPTNGFVNLTSLPLTYSKVRDVSLKVKIIKLVDKKTIMWCRPIVKGYYFVNGKQQVVCFQRSLKKIYLTEPLRGNVSLPKHCIWRLKYQTEDGVPYKRLFVKNNRNRSCKKFFLGQGCSSNEDDSFFMLHAMPWVPYGLYKALHQQG